MPVLSVNQCPAFISKGDVRFSLSFNLEENPSFNFKWGIFFQIKREEKPYISLTVHALFVGLNFSIDSQLLT